MRHWRHLICLTTLLLAGFASTSAGQDGSPVPGREAPLEGGQHALAELVEWALRHSELPISHRARVEERSYAANQARMWPNPSMDLSVGRRQESSSSGPLYELTLAQPLPLFGKQGLRGDILDLDSKTWRLRQAAAEVGIALDVIRLSYEYTLQRRKVDFLDARQRRLELVRSYLAGRVFASPQQQVQRRLVEQRLRRLASEGTRTRAALQALFERLKFYVAFNPGQYPEIEVPRLSGAGALDEEGWTSRVISGNPDLAIQKTSLRSAELERTLAAREAWPDLSVVAFYGEGTAAATERNVGAGLSLALPLWNRNQAGIKSAGQKAIAEDRLLALQRRRLRADLSRSFAEYEAARRVVAQNPPSLLSEMEAQLKETEREFRKGRVDLLTFLELESETAEAFNRFLDAQAGLAARIVDLLALSGEQNPLAGLHAFLGEEAGHEANP